ncbi:ubiquinone/menaquinone biosynthesis C-methylase UbiE [Kibdelosporangium banguiense]|uniref:Ubiquinone/menaquinone biosynthesis C-methylase UbiE n=1 Tax=Kibdelosporangium banguiense TaxID=1365924 RepID=A0ABS4TBB3_9PSEU|nr:methyltransferase domain-containing protein [Kibdelosporangium banguiense]MBP2321712.1 ubiquinone/menaquinone biosynthesis C-methylase UbiE [Kibdelosporangium banguiense]
MTTKQQRFWDRASMGFRVGERAGEPYRYLSVKALGLREGESVLDVGCGAGGEFKLVRQAVGDTGRIFALDFSTKLVNRAQQRVDDAGWSNVEVRHLDATKDSLGDGEFDAALAMTSLSTMPNVDVALDNIYKALRPGGRLFVADVNPSGLFRVLYKRLAGAPGIDVAQRVKHWFDEVDLLDEHVEPVAWRTPAPWYLMVLARKS